MTRDAARLADILEHAGRLLTRLDALLPAAPPAVDWKRVRALRWRRTAQRGWLEAIAHPHTLRLTDLHCVAEQKTELVRNTRQFLAGLPANNALLTGARGTGKSSLIKALLNTHAKDGLRLVEVAREDLADLPDILAAIEGRPEHFILYCDDLSFEAGDASYKTFKAALDGSLAADPERVLIYASSNRRHLLPESMEENLAARHVGGELHPGEATEEKISLSERFGLWLAFHPFTQDEYLLIVRHWLRRLGARVADEAVMRAEALRFALARGSRSGRVANQFARDYAGRNALTRRR
jgi:hypothetical protein